MHWAAAESAMNSSGANNHGDGAFSYKRGRVAGHHHACDILEKVESVIHRETCSPMSWSALHSRRRRPETRRATKTTGWPRQSKMLRIYWTLISPGSSCRDGWLPHGHCRTLIPGHTGIEAEWAHSTENRKNRLVDEPIRARIRY